MRGLHPIESHIHIELTGVEGTTEVSVYMDGSKQNTT